MRVCSTTGAGIPELTAALEAIAREVPVKDDSTLFRLPIDRAFTMKGFGTVVSGTLMAGRIRRDDEVEILPGRRAARVRGIQVHGGQVEEARAGQRTALNLQRIELEDVERGMVVCPPGVFAATTAFDVHIELLRSAPGPIVRRKRIRFHIGTAEVIGHVVLLGQDVLEPGGSAFAQVLLERPAFALPGDRFILRQILADGDARRRRDPRRASRAPSPIRSHRARPAADPPRRRSPHESAPWSTPPAHARWTWTS